MADRESDRDVEWSFAFIVRHVVAGVLFGFRRFHLMVLHLVHYMVYVLVRLMVHMVVHFMVHGHVLHAHVMRVHIMPVVMVRRLGVGALRTRRLAGMSPVMHISHLFSSIPAVNPYRNWSQV
jgi:hypothetical protein